MSNIAPALVRKGIGALTILDGDVVEVSNLNRQRFYPPDIGTPKAISFVRNLRAECIHVTRLVGHAVSLETAIYEDMDLDCDVAICGVDNNPGRVAASGFFRSRGIPVIFSAVSIEADHGYVFVQEAKGPCIACLFPDIISDESYPCPGTPAISDILQLVGALATYAVDSVLMSRPRDYNYRSIHLPFSEGHFAKTITVRSSCDTVVH
jgi:molybdopterin/thiamine biosynthesis adenylyltransferase